MSGVCPARAVSPARRSAPPARRIRSRSHAPSSRIELRVGSSPPTSSRRILSRSSSIAAPSLAETSTRSVHEPVPIRSSRSGRSILLTTRIVGTPHSRLRISRSSGVSGSLRSRRQRTRSDRSIARRVRRTPSASTGSPGSLRPAVSIQRTGIPLREASSSTVSRVVPGIGVTIARSSARRAFKRVDLPTFGRPTIAIVSPSRMIRPSSLWARRTSMRRDRSSILGRTAPTSTSRSG